MPHVNCPWEARRPRQVSELPEGTVVNQPAKVEHNTQSSQHRPTQTAAPAHASSSVQLGPTQTRRLCRMPCEHSQMRRHAVGGQRRRSPTAATATQLLHVIARDTRQLLQRPDPPLQPSVRNCAGKALL